MPKTQTLRSQTLTQRVGDQDLRGSARCLRPRGRRERSIDDLHKIQEDYNWFSQEHSPEIINPNNWFTSSIYREEKKPPKQLQVGFIIRSDPTVGRSPGRPRPTQMCGRLLDRPHKVLWHYRTYWKCQSTARSTDPSVWSIEQSTAQLQDLLESSVD